MSKDMFWIGIGFVMAVTTALGVVIAFLIMGYFFGG